MSEENAGVQAIRERVAEIASMNPGAESNRSLDELSLRYLGELSLLDLLDKVESSDEDVSSAARRALLLADMARIEDRLADARRAGALPQRGAGLSWLASFVRLAGPVTLALAAGGVGGALATTQAAWTMIAVLIGVAWVLAWVSKLEHDREYADVLDSASQAASDANASLDRLGAVLARTGTSLNG